MRKSLLIPGCLLLLVVVFFPQIRLGTFTALFLWDLLDEQTLRFPDRGSLSWVTASPAVERLQIPVGKRRIAADLYHPRAHKKRAAILLTHGIIEAGKDDPRLIRFARSLARTGFVVLVPELKGMKSFRILLSDVDDIIASFHYLASRQETVDQGRMGLLGFSYGAGPTFIAAADPSMRDQVKFLVSFGGYYDPVNVIRFITTGFYDYRGERGFQQPEPYGKWVFFMNNVDYVQSKRDRKLLTEVIKEEERQNTDKVAPLLAGLTPQGKNLYELLVNKDPQRVERLIKGTDLRFQHYLKEIAIAPIIPSIRAYFLIGHGSTDPLIPYTESLRLADAIPDKGKVHLAIIRLFSHVDPVREGFSPKEFLTNYLPSRIKFFYLIYDLLSQQQ
ncbi:MAG: dienelactone hydrolase family protein [Candidatus Binatia bacterium]